MNPVLFKLLLTIFIKLLEYWRDMTPEQKQELSDAVARLPVNEETKRDPITAGYAEP